MIVEWTDHLSERVIEWMNEGEFVSRHVLETLKNAWKTKFAFQCLVAAKLYKSMIREAEEDEYEIDVAKEISLYYQSVFCSA